MFWACKLVAVVSFKGKQAMPSCLHWFADQLTVLCASNHRLVHLAAEGCVGVHGLLQILGICKPPFSGTRTFQKNLRMLHTAESQGAVCSIAQPSVFSSLA